MRGVEQQHHTKNRAYVTASLLYAWGSLLPLARALLPPTPSSRAFVDVPADGPRPTTEPSLFLVPRSRLDMACWVDAGWVATAPRDLIASSPAGPRAACRVPPDPDESGRGSMGTVFDEIEGKQVSGEGARVIQKG